MTPFIIMDLLWKLAKVPRVVLILVVDHVPVGLVGLNALRGRKTDNKNMFGSSAEEDFLNFSSSATCDRVKTRKTIY